MSDKRWERLREKFATEQASPTPCPMFTLPEVAMLFERIAELEAQLAKVRIEANACEVCGVHLLPQFVRCEQHVNTERGDPEWPEDE